MSASHWYEVQFHCDRPGCDNATQPGLGGGTKKWKARYDAWHLAKKAGWQRRWLPRYAANARFYDLCEQCARTWRGPGEE